MRKVQQVSEIVTQRLIHEIQSGVFAGQSVLPPEVEIAALLNVNRNTVRESLTRLEREGWVVRKHGIGTLVNQHVVSLKYRLDQTYGVKRALILSGKAADSRVIELKTVQAGTEIAKHLELEEGEPIMSLSIVFLADGKPSIFCVDYIPERIILKKNYDKDSMQPTVFQFLKDYCGGAEIEIFLTELRAMPPSEEAAKALEVPLTSGLLFMAETGYDLRSKPVLYSEVFFLDRVIPQMVIRKMI